MMRVLILLAGMLMALVLSSGVGGAEKKSEVYGAEPNPTGDPIGGGPGYSRILDKGDYTVKTVEELLAALKQAKAGQVVYVAADKIDLAGHTGIEIPAGVTLAGNRGKGGSPGPLLFNKEMPRSHSLLNPKENVRITGVRIRGSDDSYPEINYDVRPASWCPGIVARYPNLEVDNCEISNFHHSGVSANSKNVHVHHNFIHDTAYPVCVVDKAQPPILIEANLIHWGWHAIAGTGAPGTGYEARYNICVALTADKFSSWLKKKMSKAGHGFDMHRCRCYKKDKTFVFCPGEMGGDLIIIHHNTVRNNGPTLGALIRGIPREICQIYNNWFSEEDPAMAVRQVKPLGNMWVYNNAHGPEKKVVPIATQTTPQILFKSPQQPTRELEKMKGKLALDIEVNVLQGLQLKSVVVELDGKEIYSGAQAPQPGKVVINTQELENGEHKLTVTATDNRGGEAKRLVALQVEN